MYPYNDHTQYDGMVCLFVFCLCLFSLEKKPTENIIGSVALLHRNIGSQKEGNSAACAGKSDAYNKQQTQNVYLKLCLYQKCMFRLVEN